MRWWGFVVSILDGGYTMVCLGMDGLVCLYRMDWDRCGFEIVGEMIRIGWLWELKGFWPMGVRDSSRM